LAAQCFARSRSLCMCRKRQSFRWRLTQRKPGSGGRGHLPASRVWRAEVRAARYGTALPASPAKPARLTHRPTLPLDRRAAVGEGVATNALARSIGELRDRARDQGGWSRDRPSNPSTAAGKCSGTRNSVVMEAEFNGLRDGVFEPATRPAPLSLSLSSNARPPRGANDNERASPFIPFPDGWYGVC